MEKTVTKTFRLDGKIHKALVSEAEKQKTSLNCLVNQILEDYTVFGRHAKRAKVLRFGPSIVNAVLSQFSDDLVSKVGGEIGKRHPAEFLSGLGLPYTLDNVTRLLTEFLSRHTQWFENPEIVKEANGWMIDIRHGLNRKWSLFLTSYVSAMFSTFNFKKIESKNVDDFYISLHLTI